MTGPATTGPATTGPTTAGSTTAGSTTAGSTTAGPVTTGPVPARTLPELPAALAPWSRQLAALAPDAAVALGPMIRRLDELVGRHLAADGRDGDPDGFDGLSRRGDPGRMLVSQWLIAQDLPDEFARRAATGELLYLAPARRHPDHREETVVLADCGPDQHGAPRLVQLAMTVVLHRRALAAGRRLRVGVLGAPAESWLEGDLPEVLDGWLASRRRTRVTPSDVQDRLALLDRPEQAWVLTGAPPGRPPGAGPAARVVTVQEADWSDDGPAAVTVVLAGERLHLPLPDPQVCVRILRGAGWARRPPPDRTAAGSLRRPVLHGSPPVLLARGDRDGEIVAQGIPGAGSAPPRPRRHLLDVPVLAASRLGSRMIFLTAPPRSDHLAVRVSGKALGRVAGIQVPLEQLELTGAAVTRLADGPPADVFFHAGALLTCLDGRWWRLRDGGPPVEEPQLVAVATSQVVDQPRLARRWDTRLVVHLGARATAIADALPATGPAEVLVGRDRVAWRDGAGTWRVAGLPGAPHRDRDGPVVGTPLRVDGDSQVLGLVVVHDRAGLVTVGPGGLLVKLVTTEGSRVLTEWSGGVTPPVVHPRYPLLAVDRGGRIEVGDLTTGHVRVTLAAGP